MLRGRGQTTAEKEIRSCKGGDLRYCAIRRSLTNRAAFIAVSTCNLTVEVWFNVKTFQLPFRYFKIRGKSFINSTCTQIYIAYERTYEIWRRRKTALSDYQVTTNTKATVLDRQWKNFSQNLLRFFYYNLSYVASNVLRSPPGAACSSTVSWLSRVSWRSRLWKEAVISLTVTRLKEESENERARRRERATLARWGGVAKAFNFPLLADGGRHTPFRSELSLPENYGRRMSGWGGPNVA